MKGLFFFVIAVFLFLGCQNMEEQLKVEEIQRQSMDRAEEMGKVTEDVLEQLEASSETTQLISEESQKIVTGPQMMEERIKEENSRTSGMIASVSDAEREKIINENRWGISIHNLENGSTMYYDRNGNFLGKRGQ